jgi:hypothetical protein
MALVLTLAAVVLVTVIITAFFSKALINRQISFSSTNLIKTGILSQSAEDWIVGELREEIRNGSTPTTVTTATGSGVAIYTPSSAAKIVPTRDSSLAEANLVRISSDNPPPTASALKASSVTASTASLNNRYVSLSRWDKIALRSSPTSSTTEPKWVLVTREGVPSTGTVVPSSAGDKNDKNNYVVGRFAYAIYDEGGLLDANLAGAPSTVSATDASKKGLVALADLTALGLSSTQATGLADWRNAATKSDYINYIFGLGSTHGAAAANGFTEIAAGDNTFLNRQDLINYASSQSLNTTSLNYLSTFSYEKNSPSIAAGSDATLNPDFSKLISPVTHKPLQRFPLSRFALLDQNPSTLSAPDRADILKYFGLVPGTGASDTYRVWQYKSATVGSAAAAISSGTDPDLFELVHDAIANGSLGVYEPDSTNINVPIMNIRDSAGGSTPYSAEANPSHQVARIIANMIDQYDTDNYPTTIITGSNPVANTVYGIEHLPYFSELLLNTCFPNGVADKTGATFSLYFKLWDPHRGPVPAKGPANVRIVITHAGSYNIKYVGGSGDQSCYNNTQQTLDATYTSNGIAIGPLSTYANPAIVTGSIALAPPELSSTYGAVSTLDLHITSLSVALQYQDADGNWHTYTTFAGHDNDSGATGLYFDNTVYKSSNTDPNFKNYGPAYPNLDVPKPDPRTFRFRTGATRYPYLCSGTGTLGSETAPNHYNYITEHFPSFYGSNGGGGSFASAGMLYKNDGTSNVAVKDHDGTARVGDGHLGANPMSLSSDTARPIILNRPFRSVGELGYVYRDSPWKSLNFFSSDSGDAGLLDIFSLGEGDVVAGRTSLNTAHPEVLQALIQGTLTDEVTTTGTISVSSAQTIADDITNQTKTATSTPAPIEYLSGIATQLTNHASTVDTNYPAIKTQREALARALAAGTQTRTWNLLIDMIVQSGRYPPKPSGLGKFVVEGERHCWLHVAIDRYTGEVLQTQREVVNE